jgi:hypothetical protein
MVAARAFLTATLLAGCAGTVAHTAPTDISQPGVTTTDVGRLDVSPFVVPNEHSVFSLSYGGIEVGRIELRTGEPGIVDGRQAIIVWSETRSDGIVAVVVRLREQVLTTIDLGTGIPIARQGSFAGLFSGREGDFQAEAIPWAHTDAHNTHAAVAMLRAWDPVPGTRGSFTLVVEGQRNHVDVVAAGRELIDSDDGELPTVRIEGNVRGVGSGGEDRKFVIWFSDDRHRKLLRLDSETDYGGVLSLVLIRYDSP